MYHRLHLGQFCDSDGDVEKCGEERNGRERSYQWIVKVAGGKRYKPGVKFLIYGMRERSILLCRSGCALGDGHSGGLARGSCGRRHEKECNGVEVGIS
jgi:hypothetical protein